MIAKLRGTLDSAGDGWAVVDIGGVGYLAYCSGRTLGALPAAGGPVTLLIDTHVREDHIHLYGFGEAAEREWFRLLQSVQGVGAKMALGILTVLDPESLANAIAAQDRVPLTRASGVGPKVAARVVAELKDKAGALAGPVVMASGAVAVPAGTAPSVAEAVSALVNLGYGRAEAYGVIAIAHRARPEANLSSLIRAGLKDLAS